MEHIKSILSAANLGVQANNEQSEGKESISPSNCKYCGMESTLHIIKGFGNHPDFQRYFPDCDCESKEMKREDDARRSAEIEKRINEAIPAKFRACRFDTFIPKSKQQQSALSSLKSNPAGSFYIHGAYGSGKTHLLCAQFRERMPKESCYLRTTSELIREIRQEELGNDRSEIMAKIRSRTNFHLFWDDCDKVKTTEFKLEIVFDLIDGIYKHEMGLSITGNSNLLELQPKLSPAICRRIDDICQVIEL
jgi:DNA replication protein DnaC